MLFLKHQASIQSMNIEIRKAIPTDASEIASFQVEMAWETEQYRLDPETVQKGVSAVFTDENRGCYYVATVDNMVVASLLTTFEWSDWRNCTVLWIQSVFVRPGFRQQGIFAQLYNHIKNEVETNPSLAGIRLYVDITNLPAQEVYQRLGMKGDHYKVFEWMKF
jgi:GNAT superfamily N-acetyltransferase